MTQLVILWYSFYTLLYSEEKKNLQVFIPKIQTNNIIK